MHKDNSFITLTYNDQYLPANNSLVPRDLQLFFKRLRKVLDCKIRYLACGEYGEKTERPHYHAIIFGANLRESRTPLELSIGDSMTTGSSRALYSSDLLAKVWPYGHNVVGNVTFESCSYVARYCMKKITGPLAEDYYGNRVPPFLRVSNRPGIAADWLKKYGMSDVWNNDTVVIRGHETRPPRFFEKKLAIEDEILYNIVKQNREVSLGNVDIDRDRLRVVEECMKLKLEKVARCL